MQLVTRGHYSILNSIQIIHMSWWMCDFLGFMELVFIKRSHTSYFEFVDFACKTIYNALFNLLRMKRFLHFDERKKMLFD